MSSFRVCPTADPNITRMEFDYYHMETGEKFEEYFRFVRQVAMEDYELCEKAQENLEKGVYREGILNPEKESGVSCKLTVWFTFRLLTSSVYQDRVFEMVCQQHAADREKEVSSKSKLEGPEPVQAAGVQAVA